jgi:nicotinamide-nucleotide amidase
MNTYLPTLPMDAIFLSARHEVNAIAAGDLEVEAVRMATHLGRRLAALGWMVCTAESCTGGAIARALTETGGSSAWFDCAYITYSNRAKMADLAVSESILLEHGAVSEATVRAMAEGAIRNSACHLALSVSGVAGPSGGSPEKPLGTVCFAWAWSRADGAMMASHTVLWSGDRHEVRLRTVCFAVRVAELLLPVHLTDQAKPEV